MSSIVKKQEVINSSKKEDGITFDEYKRKYTFPERKKLAKTIIVLGAFLIGSILAYCLTMLVLKIYELNNIAGYVAIGVAAILFIAFYIVPLTMIARKPFFVTNVNEISGAKAKRHNRMVRHQIADKMIEITSEVNNISWYSKELVGELAIARQRKDEELLKNTLTAIYNTDVKKTFNKITISHAVQVGILTALSPSEKLDAMAVALYELNLIKDIIYLYGFRPSDSRLMKIYLTILNNTLLAYGLAATSERLLTTGISATLGGAAIQIPIIGGFISSIIGSATQGVVNGVMTVILANQTKKYLMKEYKLQNILDGFEFEDEEEKEIEIVQKEIKKAMKNSK